MSDSATVLRYLREVKAGRANEPNGFPDSITPYLRALYSGQQAGNAEHEWDRIGQALRSAVPELVGTSWADIQPLRKYRYNKYDFHRLEEEPPALTTTDGKTILLGEGQILVYAPTRSFKSFIALRWANQLAMDGKRVLFCVGERFKPFAKRSRAHDSYYEDAPPKG